MYDLYRDRVLRNGDNEKDILLNERIKSFNRYLDKSPHSNFLIWQDDDLSVFKEKCILKNKTISLSDGVDRNKHLVTIENQIVVTVVKNEITSNISENMRFIFNNSKNNIYKAMNVNTLKMPGFINIIMEKDFLQSDDRVELNIANFKDDHTSQEPTDIIEGEITIKKWSMKTYTINMPVTWSVSNNNVSMSDETSKSVILKGEVMGKVVLTADDGVNQYTKEIEVINAW